MLFLNVGVPGSRRFACVRLDAMYVCTYIGIYVFKHYHPMAEYITPGGVGQAHRRVRAYEKVTLRSSHSTAYNILQDGNLDLRVSIEP